MKKRIIRILAGLLTAVILIAALPFSPLPARASHSSLPARPAERSEDDTILLSTAEQLFAFAAEVNAGNQYEGKTVTLTADLHLGEEAGLWTPIGSQSAPFAGIFDGGYHVISGLSVASGSGVGLFGCVKGGTVRNLVVDGTVSGSAGVAGLVGVLDNGSIQNCGNRATVSGGSNVGGIAGAVNGNCTVESCFNTGSVTGTTGYIGGVTGQHFRAGTVENCYNTGAVSGPATVGGVTGGHQASSPVLTSCYNAGSVTDSAGAGNYVCAVLGRAKAPTVTNCYYLINGTADDTKEGVTGVPTLSASRLGAAFTDGESFPVLTWEEKISTEAPVLPAFTDRTGRAGELAALIRAAVSSARAHGNIGTGTLLGSDAYLSGASSTGTDWMALAMARFGYFDARGNYCRLIDDGTGYGDYLTALRTYIEQTYAENGGILHSVKATEWHRAVAVILALGGDPTQLGTYNGRPIDLIADGSFNCVVNGGPGKQGINGWIWGLIAMDTGDFAVPENARYPRETFIREILKMQLTDGAGGNLYGGWVLGGFGTSSDIDITAMALQALAPYYSDSTVYTYTNEISKEERSVTVRQCVEEALAVLSARMDRNGGFSSWGSKNVEGISQVLVALCSLGIDPASDPRFLSSEGKTLLDGLLQFRLADGGFCHTADGGWNSMANDQATYALVSYWRLENGMRALYDMRGALADEQKAAIRQAVAAIDRLPDPSSGQYKARIREALAAFRAVPAKERRYVKNYSSFAAALELVGGESRLDTNDPYAVALRITRQPDRLQYFEGDCFEPDGMEVTAVFSDGTEQPVRGFRYAPSAPLTLLDQTVTVYYGILKVSVSITVSKKLPWEGADPGRLEIRTEEELIAFAEFVNGGENFAGKSVVLTADLDLSGLLWTPIGLSQKLAFAGSFDGQGHTIDNLFSSLGGLFGYAADSAVIRNVSVASGEIGGDTGYRSFFGGIVGWSEGADIINCRNGADLFCSSYSGGIVGTVRGGESVISGCFNSGKIIGHENSTRLGGIVGHLDTGHPVTVADCYNTGDITGGDSVGGIVGAMQNGPHTVERCYNAGTVTAVTPNAAMKDRVGAIIGEATRSLNTVETCYYLAGSCLQGGMGTAVQIADTTVPLSEAQMKDGTLLSALGGAFKCDPYGLVNSGWPLLLWQPTGEADAVEEVFSLIDAIGEVTLDREEAVRAAREAYEALGDPVLQALVSNYDVLTEAEEALQVLKDAADPSKPTDPGDSGNPGDSGDPSKPLPPQTGDPSHLPFFILLVIVCGLTAALVPTAGKARRKR